MLRSCLFRLPSDNFVTKDRLSAVLTTDSGNGIHNGKWSMVCKSCGWNTTHITGYRDKWVADPKSFSFLPPIFSGLNQERILLREAVVGL